MPGHRVVARCSAPRLGRVLRVAPRQGPCGVFANGFLNLGFGSFIVAFHNVWEGLRPSDRPRLGSGGEGLVSFVLPQVAMRSARVSPERAGVRRSRPLVFTRALVHRAHSMTIAVGRASDGSGVARPSAAGSRRGWRRTPRPGSLAAADYVYIAPNGMIMDRAAILAVIRSPSYRLIAFAQRGRRSFARRGGRTRAAPLSRRRLVRRYFLHGRPALRHGLGEAVRRVAARDGSMFVQQQRGRPMRKACMPNRCVKKSARRSRSPRRRGR